MGEITNVVALSRKLRDNYPIVRLYGTSLFVRCVAICTIRHCFNVPMFYFGNDIRVGNIRISMLWATTASDVVRMGRHYRYRVNNSNGLPFPRNCKFTPHLLQSVQF